MVAISVASVAHRLLAAPSKRRRNLKTAAVLKGKGASLLITGSASGKNCDRLSVIATTPYQLDRIGRPLGDSD